MGQSSSKRVPNRYFEIYKSDLETYENDLLLIAFLSDYKRKEWNCNEFVEFFEDSGVPVNFLLLMFKNFDKDKSGKVDFKEYLIVMDKVTNGSDDDKIGWFFRMADKNGNGKVNLQDWRVAMGADAKTANKESKKMFKKLDKNRQHLLSVRMFKRGCAQIEGLKELVLQLIDIIAETPICKLERTVYRWNMFLWDFRLAGGDNPSVCLTLHDGSWASVKVNSLIQKSNAEDF